VWPLRYRHRNLGVCLAAFPAGTRAEAYSIVAGVALSGLFAKQVPANKAKRQLTADAWLGGSGHSEHRQNPRELRCHHPRPHNQALRLCSRVRPTGRAAMTTAKGDRIASIKSLHTTVAWRHCHRSGSATATYYCNGQATRLISTARLNALRRLHLQPINLVVSQVPSGTMWYGMSHLGGGFALRCIQRLSLPNIATQRCHWHDNWYTRGSSTRVLSYYGQRPSNILRPRQIRTELSHDVLNPTHVPL
jgi:hypothetical protein